MKIIDNNKTCCSCTACSEICPRHAIGMKEVDDFFYPYVDEEYCINCSKCQKVCPINHLVSVDKNTAFYASINKNTADRENSTSGGVFSLIAQYVLSKHGVVYGASYNENNEVHHEAVYIYERLSLFSGAKYTQSDLGHVFVDIKKQLEAGVKILFSGMPCQVAGLKNFLGKEYDQLITVDLVCHGIPSPVAWREYLKYRQKQDGQQSIASSVNLRSKSTGWSRYGYSVSFKYDSGYEYSVGNSEDPYMQAFVNNMILRPSCNDCQFKGVHRCSDFTLGDFWGVWDYRPEMDDDKGTSLVMVHSDKGRELWKQIQDKCHSVEITEKEALAQNPSIVKSSPAYYKRDELMKRLETEGFAVVEAEVEKIRKERMEREKADRKVSNSLVRRVKSKVKRLLF